MSTLKIEGGRRLEGRVAVEGNKNAALPLLAACLLTDEECVLTNVPRIRDVEVLVDLLVGLGATAEGRGTSTLRVRCANVTSDRPDPVLVGKLRGSVLLLGPLLARRGSARLAPPGGDFPKKKGFDNAPKDKGKKGPLEVDRAAVKGGIQWFATWESGLREAQRGGRPILLVSAAPHCAGVSGVW